jgi:hypothetical protein
MTSKVLDADRGKARLCQAAALLGLANFVVYDLIAGLIGGDA